MPNTNKPRAISPYDLKDCTGKEEIHVEFNVYMKRKLKVPYPQKENIAGMEITNLADEVAHQLTKFALEWKQWPIPEHYVDKAMDDAKLAIKSKFRELGLSR